MNWTDLLVLTVIAVFSFIGLKKGFALSIFSIASFFISTLLALKLFPKMAELLTKIGISTYFKDSISKGLLAQKEAMMAKMGSEVTTSVFVNGLPLPESLKANVIEHMPDSSKLIDSAKILEVISDQLTKIAIDITSLILLFILIKIVLILARTVLKGIANLPVLKQLDKAGGLILGATEGLLMVYIVFFVIIFFNAWPQFKTFSDAVEKSLIAKFFYENNFIISWMFPIK